MITLYSKTGGKHGKHGSVTVSSNVSAISYAGVQVFEHIFGRLFRTIPQASTFHTKQFLFIRSISFLSLLASPPKLIDGTLELSQTDSTRFKDLLARHEAFTQAMKLFRKRQKAAAEEEGDE